MNSFDFSVKTFLITGAASGIGRNLSILLSKNNANLILLDINKDGLEETIKLCKKNHIYIIQDITKFDELKTKLDSLNCKIDGFVHCAGIPSIMPLRVLSYEEYSKVMNINTFSALEIIKWFSSNKNHKSENPSVVLISSVYGLVGSALNVAYAMSKGAIQSLTKSLAVELAPKKIRINCVAPGFIETEMKDKISKYFDKTHDNKVHSLHLLGLGHAQDISNMIAYLLSDAASWITGSIYTVDGGFTAQ